MRKVLLGILVATGVLWAAPARAEQLCDPASQDCRAILLNLIQNETVGIDVAFWFMEDSRYSAAIINRFHAGVPVRVIVDARANDAHPLNAQILIDLQNAGIPMRQRVASGILHWKMMLFAGQGQMEFSGADYSPYGLVYVTQYTNFEDEAILFSDELATLHSFMERYDDLWTDTSSYSNYANVSGALHRKYPSYPIDPQMNFPPSVSYRNRAVAGYNAESTAIDVNMFRITDRAHTDAIIAAVQRGVKVRLITEQEEYRNPDRLWDSWNVDRMCAAGVAIRQRGHDGLNHEKVVLLRGQAMTIFGSSNWTSPSDQSQEEHNEFTTKPYFYQWFSDQFARKWNNGGPSPETMPFHPLPPDEPSYSSPASGATKISATGATIAFAAGPFAHLYDIYLGTTANPGLIAVDVDLGPTAPGDSPRSYTLPALASGTTYYWKVVAKTMARQRTEGPVWSFTTAGSPGAPKALPSPAPPAGPVNTCGADDSTSPSPGPGPSPSPGPGPTPTPGPHPLMSIDAPRMDAAVQQPFAVTGWVLDTGATADNGIDVVHVWAYPASGAPPIFVGWTSVNSARPDVGGYFGALHNSSGYGLLVRGLQPGAYTIVVFGHSTLVPGFPIAQPVRVNIGISSMLSLDTPAQGASVGQGFMVGGWAADFGSPTGGGIDLVHVYAYPLDTGGAPIFLGQAMVNVPRPDVGAYFGPQFTNSGFNLFAPALPPGHYRIVAFGRSLVVGTFSVAKSADVTLR
jgi:PLD-like domain